MAGQADRAEAGAEQVKLLTMRPDFANTEYLAELNKEWHSHDFSIPPFSAEAAQKVSANSSPEIAKANADFVQPSGPVASRAGSVLTT
jgi:hypothetical protein